MRLFRLLGLLLALLIASSMWGAEIARWEAGKGGKPGAVTLANVSGNRWTLRQQHKIEVAAVEPTHDFYRRAEFVVKIGTPKNFPVWLTGIPR